MTSLLWALAAVIAAAVLACALGSLAWYAAPRVSARVWRRLRRRRLDHAAVAILAAEDYDGRLPDMPRMRPARHARTGGETTIELPPDFWQQLMAADVAEDLSRRAD